MVLVGLTVLVLALAAWAHAVDPQDEAPSIRTGTSLEDEVVGLDGRAAEAIDVLNAKSSKRVVLDSARDLGRYRYTVRDSQGRSVDAGEIPLAAGPRAFTVPVSGLLSLERVAARP